MSFPPLYFRPRLRTILLIVNLTVLVLPLGSLFFLRIYENQLVQQTEAELISQAALIGAIFAKEVKTRKSNYETYGIKLDDLPQRDPKEYYTPIEPQLDLAQDETHPPRPDGILPKKRPDAVAANIGRNLNNILIQAQKTTLAGMKVLDYQGISIASRKEPGLTFAHIKEIQIARTGRYASLIRQRISDEPPPSLASISRGTGIRLFVAYPILYRDRLWGVVYLSRTPKNALKHMYAERDKFILAVVLLLTITLLLTVLTSATISRPIHELISRIKRVSQGDWSASQSLKHSGTKEMLQLSESFSEMSKSLYERSEYIRNFAAHVSHEFKTPLTSIQGAAELLSEHKTDMSAQEREKFLNNIIHDSNRLEQLVKRLLELARADNITPGEDVIEIVNALQDLKSSYSYKGFEISLQMKQKAHVKISKENIAMVFSNLFENSKQHNADQIVIKSDSASKDNKIIMTVSDNGEGVSKANRDKIFTPFFTTKREQGGTGLGLGIVQSLIEAHHGQIHLVASETGACFRIVLPKEKYLNLESESTPPDPA